MKKIISSLLFLFLSVHAYSQIREYVFVVRPDYNTETITYLSGVADALEAEGYNGLVENQSDRDDGRFGSGFLFVTEDGTVFVVTNRHVVGGADSVILQQEMQDGSIISFENNRIAAVDDSLDLALVRIEDVDSFSGGLVFADEVPADGTDVWSAGYPGLGGKPAWQFGKGNVTNSRARIEDLLDPEKSTLIQHSAPVDPGNSGGPLLVAAEESAGDYRVVGINTWKAFSRQAANFAVPAPMVRAFIQASISPLSEEQLQAQLGERAAEFAAVISNAEFDENLSGRIERIASFISSEYVREFGEAALIEVLRYAPSDVRREVLHYVSNASLLEGMRLACAYSLYDSLTAGYGDDVVLLQSGAPEVSENKPTDYRFTTAEGENVELAWIVENGSWRIASSDFDLGRGAVESEGEASGATAQFSFEAAYYGHLFAEYSYISDVGGIFGGGILVGSQYLTGGTSVSVGSVDVEDPYYGTTSSLLIRMLLIGRLQFPVVSDTYIVNPFAEVRGGFQMAPDTDSMSGLMRSLGLGVELGYNAQNVNYILGLSWKSDKVLSSSFDDGEDTTQSTITVSFGIGMY